MLSFSRTHPYLDCSLAMLGLLVALLFCSRPAQRRHALWSAVLATPFAFLEHFAIPMYWNPRRTAVWMGVSPEDFLFAFTIGGISWLLATFLWRDRLAHRAEPRNLLQRYTLVSAVGLPLSLGTLLLEVKPMSYTLVPILVAGSVFLILRPALWRFAVPGMAGYAAVHAALLKVSFAVTPSFVESWNATNLWGPTVWGVPLDEIIWASAFGAVWPVFAAYVFDVTLLPPERAAQPVPR